MKLPKISNLFTAVGAKLTIFFIIGIILFSAPLLLTVSSSSWKLLAQAKILQSPQNFTIDLINQKDVILLWDESTDKNIKKYVIQRSDRAGLKPEKIAELDVAESSYIDTTVEKGKTYTYRVQSTATGFVAGDSEVKSVKVVDTTEQKFGEQASEGVVSSPGSESNQQTTPDQESQRFFQTIIIGNVVVISILLLIFFSIRRILLRRRAKLANPDEKISHPANLSYMPNLRSQSRPENKSESKTSSETRPKAKPETKSIVKPKIKVKSGKPDVNITEEAHSRYYSKRKNKLQEWLAADDAGEAS